MAFNDMTKQVIDSYILEHLPDEPWYKEFFDFIKDEELAERLAREYRSIRYIYKFLEGVQADGWLMVAQIKVQILFYASIYEAVIHYLLFDLMPDNPEVKALTETIKYNRISVSKKLDNYVHDGKKILTMYQTVGEKDQTKVRFDEKVKAAQKIGFITEDLAEELINIYEIRNAIHIQAELRKELEYELKMSWVAYRRMKIFREQVVAKMKELGFYQV